MAKNNLLTEQLRYTGESNIHTRVDICSYDRNSISNKQYISLSVLGESVKEDAINWIQVSGFQDIEAIKGIFSQFEIDFLTRQDIFNSAHLPKIEEHEEYNVLILKLLKKNDNNDYESIHLCIIQGKSYLITFSEEETEIFRDIVSAIDNNTLKIRQKPSDYLLSVILNEVISNYMSVVIQMEEELEDVEESLIISENADNLLIEKIQQFRRNHRLIRKCIIPLKEQYNKLFHTTDNDLFNESQRPFFNDVNDHLMFVIQTMENCRDLINAISDLYMSKNNQRLNDIMKQLAIVSTIFIPLTFLAGLWGMNFKYMPELNWEYGYFMAYAVMLTIGITLFFFFKHKKW